MGKKLFIAFVVLFSVIFVSPAGAGPDMQEGLWEIATQTKMQGMSMPPMTIFEANMQVTNTINGRRIGACK